MKTGDLRGQSHAATMTRREFVLRAPVAALAGSVGLSMLLDACGTSPNAAPPASSAGGTASTKVTLPKYIPFNGPTPDLPGTPDGVVPPAYLKYPTNLVKSVPQPPGKGSDVNAMVYTVNAAPTPLEQNAAWQQANKELGVNLKIPAINLADYPTKLSTVIAGGSLPDILGLAAGPMPFPGMPEFLTAQCTDLTPFLAGDAIKDYPNLANVPPYAWPVAVFNQKIYGVPVARAGLSSSVMLGKKKAIDQLGITQINNTDDFMKMLKGLTKPGSQWGLGAQNPVVWFLSVFGAPNNWAQSGGKFTKDWETPAYKEALAYTRSLWDAGVVFPDSPTLISNSLTTNWLNGKYIFWLGGFLVFLATLDRAAGVDPTFQPWTLAPFSHDGKGKGTYPLANGASGLMFLKKAPPDRIKELLGVINYLAAPFGTQEALLLQYGVKDIDFKFDDQGNPVPTQKGIQDTYVPWRSIASMPDALYDPTSQDFTKAAYQTAKDNFTLGIHSATVGLYSTTDAQKGAVLTQKMQDAINAIQFGRSDVSTLDQAVKDWRAAGGDQIRGEYEQALQDSTK